MGRGAGESARAFEFRTGICDASERQVRKRPACPQKGGEKKPSGRQGVIAEVHPAQKTRKGRGAASEVKPKGQKGVSAEVRAARKACKRPADCEARGAASMGSMQTSMKRFFQVASLK